jgi:hypothetical protein
VWFSLYYYAIRHNATICSKCSVRKRSQRMATHSRQKIKVFCFSTPHLLYFSFNFHSILHWSSRVVILINENHVFPSLLEALRPQPLEQLRLLRKFRQVLIDFFHSIQITAWVFRFHLSNSRSVDFCFCFSKLLACQYFGFVPSLTF